MLNNLDVIQEAWIGGASSMYAGADSFRVLSNGRHTVVIRFPYATHVGSNPNYGVAYDNGRFIQFPSFVKAMDRAAQLLRR